MALMRRVLLRKNRRVRGCTESLKEIGYQGIRRGDLVIHGMDAFAGAIGVDDSDGKGTPVYSVCKPGRLRCCARWNTSDLRPCELGIRAMAIAPERVDCLKVRERGSESVSVLPAS